MTYSEEQYNALLAVCRSYKNDCDSAFERLKEQQREIERLKAENEKGYTVRNDLLKENGELIKTNAELLLLPKQAVKEFAEKLKERAAVIPRIDDMDETIKWTDYVICADDLNELVKEYTE